MIGPLQTENNKVVYQLVADLQTRTRKKAKIHSLKIYPSDETIILINHRNVSCNINNSVYYSSFDKIRQGLAKGLYSFHITGGGTCAQLELIIKNLYPFIEGEETSKIVKFHFSDIMRTDSRRLKPKMYGGPKSNARSQKSYR